jgi:isoquinoline 1-oxidoreductase beta subunit
LVAGHVEWKLPEVEVALKPPSEYRFIGRSLPRVELEAKITSKAICAYDSRAQGMLYGAVAHPPTIGAKWRSARPGEAEHMPGVVSVVIEDGFAGVVAQSRLQAWAARDRLDVDWDEGQLWQQAELEKLVTAGGSQGVSIQREGDALRELKRTTPITAEYRTSMGGHATMEPQAALADINSEGGRVWTSTQFETSVQRDVARALDMKADQVEVIPTYLGGGFGRKIELAPVPSPSVEAARLSRAVGAPVHVGWDRPEDMRNGFVRPPTHHRLQAVLDHQDRIAAILHEQASGDALFGGFPRP